MTDAATMTAGPLPTGARVAHTSVRLVVFAAALWLMLSGVQKFLDLDAFRALLIEHAVLPAGIVPVSAWLVPAAELCLGVLAVWNLCTGESSARTRAACLGVAAMFALLALYATVLAVRPPAKPAGCGCGFSFRAIENWTPIAVRNTVVLGTLLLCTGVLAWVARRERARG